MRSETGIIRYGTLLLLCGIVVLLAAYLLMQRWMHAPLSLQQTEVVELRSGDNTATLAGELKRRGLLDHPRAFRVWTRLHAIDTRLKAGEYELEDGDSLHTLLSAIQQGRTRYYPFTLIEGWNFRQLKAALAAHEQVVHTLDGLSDAEIMQRLDADYEHPEGLFLPDTYHIQKSTRDVDLLRRAHAALQQVLEREWQRRKPGLPLENPYQALILASIVEKESAVAAERPLIAGVFINRLRKGMRLQTDPTVIYGLGEQYDGDIRFRDLRTDTPYNTYTRSGLTPTPIAMPGEEAIRAALQPSETEYLFFVAHSDRSGRHIFSRTLAEHEKQVDIHQRSK